MELKSKEEFFREAGCRSLSFSHPIKEKARGGCETDNGDKYFHSKKQIITESKNNKNLI